MDKQLHFIIDSPEWESVIEVGSNSEIQKHLNQWRHQFDIVILNCSAFGEDKGFATYLSIMRRPRAK